MLNINVKSEGEKLTVKLEGRLDTTTSPELESELGMNLDGIKELVFDFNGLEYLSSAGLRVLLNAQKTMNQQGEMKVTGVSDAVKEIFDVTGFSDILTVV
ncbi:MAG: STAS domain-containing protein [Clostridiales bacterium]|jgi:anti-sigma B factor antagonist|nr:STAS domain-containing protein [Clostridiales bacterium]MBQ2605793.1 STAS domain-containing protein [Clostridiales bacterium]MBQ4190440.1 STAS domain-containing protein [Clostridiales bacterium]MBQ5422446.1 STAS domain-containing protein [Clostridiales bacterium]MBR6210315.1 STAS domain-containing protein [Clostridiales bacterium]